MTIQTKPEKARRSFFSLLRTLRKLFNLRSDTDEAKTVETIRANVDFKSANAWTLVFAIIIASVGLNTNSTAVIIGAMLISPLMGPILGVGLGLGVNDFLLVRRSLRNLGIAVLISVLASTLYFLISPLSEIQSELLARTKPTFFDVLIAFFGGAAGIVALSRTEKSNAVPGVAIATALMPPLCTAGYGLATGEIRYFLGATYLFVINTVFICIATFVFVRYLQFAKVASAETAHENKVNRWVMAVAAVVVIPSLILAWLLQRESSFLTRANTFVKQEVKFERAFVVGSEIQYRWNDPVIRIDLVGESLSSSQLGILKEKMLGYQLDPKILEIHESSIEENIERRLADRMISQKTLAQEVDLNLARLETELQKFKDTEALSQQITEELRALLPKVNRVLIDAKTGEQKRTLRVLWKSRPAKEERSKLQEFLSIRAGKVDMNIQHFLDI